MNPQVLDRLAIRDLIDVVCTGRFYDFVEKRDERWGMVLRQPIYEKDRVDPIDPAARRGSNSIKPRWRSSRRATGIWRTSRLRSATRSSSTCRN